jgi:hypothetical protein
VLTFYESIYTLNSLPYVIEFLDIKRAVPKAFPKCNCEGRRADGTILAICSKTLTVSITPMYGGTHRQLFSLVS